MLLITAPISFFSSQDGVDSHRISENFAIKIFQLDNDELESDPYLLRKLDFKVRKLAHCFIYGVTTLILLLLFRNANQKPLLLLFMILVSVIDELNQLFKVGRGGQISDVMIDVIGICLGAITYLMITNFKTRIEVIVRNFISFNKL